MRAEISGRILKYIYGILSSMEQNVKVVTDPQHGCLLDALRHRALTIRLLPRRSDQLNAGTNPSPN